MQKKVLLAAVSSLALMSTHAMASTLAYWTFDEGTANTDVPHAAGDGLFAISALDQSGNNNHLSMWTQGSYAGFAYRADHPTIPGAPANSLSIKNTGGFPGGSNVDRNGVSGTGNTPNNLTTGNFAQWTVEASYKPETGGHRTFVGRDAQNVATGNAPVAALYLKLNPNNALEVSYVDVSGYSHVAATAPGFADPYDFSFPTDNEGTTGAWMNVAAVNDGSLLSLYNNGVLVAQTDLTLSGSPNTAIASGAETDTGNDWYAGGWTVGRGLYNGGHVDRAYGFIDNVRISDAAVPYAQLLSAVPEPTTVVTGLAAIGLIARRRRA